MKKIKQRCITFLLIGIISIFSSSLVSVHAASKKKLTVNSVYKTTKTIKGKTTKRALVKIKLGKKIYKSRADKKGNYRVRIPRQKVGKSFWVRSYQKKSGKWKLSKKKKVFVVTKKVVIKKLSKKSKVISGYARPGTYITVEITDDSLYQKEQYVEASRGIYAMHLGKSGKFSFTLEDGKPIGNCLVTIRLWKNEKAVANGSFLYAKEMRAYDL